MIPFREAQALGPFDPSLMLIQADWLEECGDAIAAAVLRGLAAAGTPSLHALALDAVLVSVQYMPDVFGVMSRPGAALGRGSGDLFESEGKCGEGDGDGDWSGHAGGYTYGDWGSDGSGDGSGPGNGTHGENDLDG